MLQKRRLPYPDEAEWLAIGTSFGWAFRERQVAALVACGVERKRAARDLGISPNTLQTHLRRAMVKANAASVVELIWRVVERREHLASV